jgi:hypothetical protein
LRQTLGQLSELGSQYRQFALNYVPDQGQVDAEVFVDELVTHAGDLPPRDGGLKQSRRLGYALYRLADDSILRMTASCVFESAKKASLPSTV